MPREPMRSTDDLARLARELYVEGPYVFRKMAHFRIRICPFERLIAHVKPGSSVLDVGCGGGLFLALLAASVRSISGVGFDYSPPAIETAVRMTEQMQRLGLPAEVKFLHLDVAQPWPAGPFDAVSLIDVLHHVTPGQQRAVFERAAQSVKPGGVLVYKDMADRPFFPAAMNRLHDLVLARQWINYVPIKQADDWARALGLECATAETIRRLWYQHDLRVYHKPLQ